MGGATSTAVLVGVFAWLALRPPMPRHSSPFNLRFGVAWLICELPLLGMLWLAVGTWSTLSRPETDEALWWVVVVVVAFDVVVLVQLLARMRKARPTLAEAFAETFGPGDPPSATRPLWWRIVLVPFVSWRPDVRRIANLSYGPSRRGNRLDVYVPRRRRRAGAPVLVYLHPGGFVMGSKKLGGHPLLTRFAAHGWVCVTADYRLRGVSYADQLADARAAIEWARTHASEWGGDPDTLFVAGGSAGAHLVATAALSGTEVSGVIGLYGYYGEVGGAGTDPSGPAELIGPDAPPFLIVHGSVDTLVLPDDVRAFAEALDAVSTRPVVHAEIPGMHHNFGFFHSLRSTRIDDAIEHFARVIIDRESVATPSGRRGRDAARS
ncbi:MAG TPA: alpha/beta hydrolase [Acidimicrobiales bacterium]|nr:alpha/beta hydrolase [Acidimicrobiales bacterium]